MIKTIHGQYRSVLLILLNNIIILIAVIDYLFLFFFVQVERLRWRLAGYKKNHFDRRDCYLKNYRVFPTLKIIFSTPAVRHHQL